MVHIKRSCCNIYMYIRMSEHELRWPKRSQRFETRLMSTKVHIKGWVHPSTGVTASTDIHGIGLTCLAL